MTVTCVDRRPHDPGDGGSHQSAGGGVGKKVSYAARVSGGGLKKKKLNMLDIFLDRRNQEISFTLSKEELAKLLFKKMKIRSTQISKIDTSAYGKIHVEFKFNSLLEFNMNLSIS